MFNKDALIEHRPYQKRIIEKVYHAFTTTKVKSCLIESPTGSGKTIVGLALAYWLQQELNIGVGWVAMRRNLLKQAARANEDLDLGVADLRLMSMFDKHPPKTDSQGRKIDLLIVDEAQHDAANSMAQLHNTIQPRHVLGLTATPFRTDSIKLCFDKVIKDAGIHALIDQGYLSQYHQYTIPQYDVETVTTHYLRDPQKWGKSVMFWHRREQADQCLKNLTDNGIKAELVVADNDPKQERRERQLAAFDSGEIDVLVNMYILTEGFDSPSLKTVWVRDSGKAPTIQMAGRVFRKHPTTSIKQVVQSKNTRWPIHRTATPTQASVWMNNRWASYKQNKNIDKISTNTSIAMITIDTTMPKYIQERKQKPNRFSENNLPQRDENGGAFIH
ncbi:MAG: DEAD/DEAH box helicase family protein [Deltaproteobacteria bacterium]|nr:DEAD/DEAH box helicase family protein [Deltaproteobacteria bacterium]